MKRRRFNTRGLISLLVASGFLVMTVTGVMLYVSPPGRVANWTDWTLLGLTKDSWAAVHISSSLLFVLAGLTHLVLNRKPLFNYLHTRIAGHEAPRAESLVAVVAIVALVWGTLAGVPPISYLLELNERAKLMWSTAADEEPPLGHAEEVSLQMLELRTRIDADRAATALTDAGLIVTDGTRTSLRAIADDNATTPAAVYRLIRVQTVPAAGPFTPESVAERFAGGGIGRLTVAQVIAETGVEPEAARARLAALGLPTADDVRLKPMADAAGLPPLEVLKAMLIEGYRPEPVAE
jgi:hypothetical protein